MIVDGITRKNGIQVVAIRDPAGSGKQFFSPVSEFQEFFCSGNVVRPIGGS